MDGRLLLVCPWGLPFFTIQSLKPGTGDTKTVSGLPTTKISHTPPERSIQGICETEGPLRNTHIFYFFIFFVCVCPFSAGVCGRWLYFAVLVAP